jgi:hypothetical protein
LISNYLKNYGIKPVLKSILKLDDWKKLKRVDILFVIYDFNRTYRYKNRAYSPLLDSLQEDYFKQGYSCLTIAAPFSQLTNGQAFGEIVDFNGSFFRAALKRLLYNVISKEEIVGTHYIKDIWLKILNRTSPTKVVTINPSLALCSACRDLGIDIAELQHGVICDAHPAYGQAYKRNCDVQTLPTSFLCWDNVAAATLQKWTEDKGIQVTLINNPWTQRFIDNNPNDDLVKDARDRQSWLKALPHMNRILVTLGWGWLGITDETLSKKYKMDVTMPQFLSFPTGLMDIILETHETVTWFIRPHPAQLSGLERKPLENYLSKHLDSLSNVFWKEVSDTPLTILLECSDLHITVDSTITSEAALFGIHTGLVAPVPRPDSYLETYYEIELESGIAEFVPNNKQAINQFIENKLAK